MNRLDEIEQEEARLKERLKELELEKRDETTIVVKEYLHSRNDEYADWELNDGKPRFDAKVHNKLHYRLYEVEFELEIDTTTGEYKILSVLDGNNYLVPSASGEH